MQRPGLLPVHRGKMSLLTQITFATPTFIDRYTEQWHAVPSCMYDDRQRGGWVIPFHYPL